MPFRFLPIGRGIKTERGDNPQTNNGMFIIPAIPPSALYHVEFLPDSLQYFLSKLKYIHIQKKDFKNSTIGSDPSTSITVEPNTRMDDNFSGV